MQLFTLVSTLATFLENEKKASHKIAFIPTMGALHTGHISLVELGIKYADITISSIYVNPSQFNNEEDLNKYPRSLEKDSGLLELANCNVLFVPSDTEIYPAGLDTEVRLNLGTLDKSMEGQFRPGHFKGMLQVVKRLLDIIMPHYLIMGQKDFQQFTLVNHMINQLGLPIKLIIGPTIREPDGLAMSSRNLRLSQEERKISVSIFQSLLELKDNLDSIHTDRLREKTITTLKNAGLMPEYVEIVDGYSLEKVIHPDKHEYIVACIAAWAGKVRVIDNLVLKGALN